MGPVFDSHGSKSLMISGTLIYILSVMFTSLSSELYQFILVQGILFGIEDTMLCDPSFSNHASYADVSDLFCQFLPDHICYFPLV